MIGTMTWAAMDVHARSTYAASLDVMTGELTRRRFDTGAVEPVVAWLAGLSGPVRACYEAGPTGFGLYRAARAAGIDCQVIAPSKTPRPSGDREQVRPPGHRSAVAPADGRGADAGRGPASHVRGGQGPGQGARADQGRSDALPPPALEAAVAPWSRVRPQGVDAGAPAVVGGAELRAAQHRAGVRRQPRGVRWARGAQAGARRAALAGRARSRVLAAGRPVSRVPRVGHAVGVDHRARGRRLHAVRSRRAARIVAWAGALTPAVRQSDTHGQITKTGSRYARRILVEAAWHYTRPPRIGQALAERHDGQPDHILQIAWRAQHRLHRIHRRIASAKSRAT